MTISDKINSDIIAAMKAKEKEKLEALRNIKKVLIEARAAKGAGTELSDEEVLRIIQKLAKQGKDSAAIFTDQDRPDLAENEMAQVKIYESFLPAKLTKEELTQAVSEIIMKTGASTMKDMGKVMGVASKELAGKAEGKDIAAIVKTLLQ